jgi:calcineurin-like phosphoesterase family protein
MATWFTSDTHFGHEGIIRLARRPFRSVEEMDAALITSWNATVAPGDTVWHMGDFCHRASLEPHVYRARLNGRIHLITGNHDQRTVKRFAHIFESVSPVREIDAGNRRLVLCHYPMREWPGAWRGAWHLFGHVHGRLDREPHGLSLDVGVDSHGFRPVGIDLIAVTLAGRASPFVASGGEVENARA